MHIIRRNFALDTHEGGRDFLLSMYNYGEEMARFVKGFDAALFLLPKRMMIMAEELPSWTDQPEDLRSVDDSRSRDSHTMQDDQHTDDDSILESVWFSPELRDVLADLGLANDIFVLPEVSE